ncbi:MAG: endonuclease/exonuclease/phosphatase family protein, partial [Chlamydiia bacterium]|nr:endonuclease/exonuclease/phosphatase family protein [Chlamydiia bacterium]
TYNEKFQNPDFKAAFEGYALKKLDEDADLKPFEWHYLYRIAQGYGYNDLAADLQAKGTQNFNSFETNAPKKTLPKDGAFSTLSGNIIFMPANYTYFFGGIQPWAERIEGIGNIILEQDADVVALQEVFDEEGAKALIDKLGSKYRYFNYDIGPNYFGHNAPEAPGIDAKNLGINSGLFIASKYPIDQPAFIPFQVEGMQWQVNKGFFVANIRSDDRVIARIISSHLQPFNSDADRKIRQAEIAAVTDYLTTHPIKAPTFFEGDLNVVFGPRLFDGELVDEYQHSGILENYIDLGNMNVTAVTDDSYTCTDMFEDAVYDREVSAPFIYDYVLLAKSDASKVENTTVRLVDTHNKNDLTQQPLSDHRLLRMDTTLQVSHP